ncbi:MAG TPA: DUF4910 domain-containing protein [Woeseiaceae bacterium]|nr:DUF4910 domain-containing protein [Woeseiaceae bacterium]
MPAHPDVRSHLASHRYTGDEIYALVSRLYPMCRSITGAGLRETLRVIQEIIPIEIHEVATGTTVFDWKIPKEWAIRDAYIANKSGARVVDFQQSNLHVVNYSCPVDTTLSLNELEPRLHSLPDAPDWIPYRTSYYNEDWGFCLTQNQRDGMADGDYRVVIESELFDGSLSYGELCIAGTSTDEIILFAHCCHPSLCNDNLSGVAMLTLLAKAISTVRLRHTIRFVFAPATIGSITWLSRNQKTLQNIRAGLVASVLGDAGKFRYKLSGQDDALIDRASTHVLEHRYPDFELLEFSPWGYDERQFCSPGIDLPVGRLTRSPNGEYPEYHTSADDLDLVAPQYLAESFEVYLEVIGCLEANRTFVNTSPQGEPQLGRRGLYGKMGGFQHIEDIKLAMLWMLNQSNGQRSLLDIAQRSKLPWQVLDDAARMLEENQLLREVANGKDGLGQ